jgi:hypothetical protein
MTYLNLDIQCGDIVLFSRPCHQMDIVSAFVCFGAKVFGWTEWDHLGLVIENPATNELCLLEANRGGITIHPLLERIKRTKSTKLAVRKLIVQNGSAPATKEKVQREFRDRLWGLSQQYLDKKYNGSLFQMTDALYKSYSHSLFFSQYLQKKHDYFILKENQYLVKSILHDTSSSITATSSVSSSASSSASSSTSTRKRSSNNLVFRFLKNFHHRLDADIERVKSEIGNMNPSTFLPSSLLDIKASILPYVGYSTSLETERNEGDSSLSEEYFCSQLIAEIFMEMDILSDHRLSHQYLPVDFSSSTLAKGLVTKTFDCLVVDDDSEFGGSLDDLAHERGKKTVEPQKYLYSPDIIIPDKKNVVFLETTELSKDGLKALPLQVPIFEESPAGSSSPSLSSDKKGNPISKTKIISLKGDPAASYIVPFHAGDILPLAVLTSFLENNNEEETVEVNGDIRIYCCQNALPSSGESTHEGAGSADAVTLKYRPIALLSSRISTMVPIKNYLKYLQEKHNDSDIYLSAVTSSSIRIQKHLNRTLKKGHGNDGKTLVFENSSNEEDSADTTYLSDKYELCFNDVVYNLLFCSIYQNNFGQRKSGESSVTALSVFTSLVRIDLFSFICPSIYLEGIVSGRIRYSPVT